MKQLFLVVCFLMSVQTIRGQQKKAFLVGIGNYEEASLGWKNISGDKDLDYLRPFLKSRGFNSITELRNEDATKERTIKKLNEFASTITDSTSVIFLYFATHGQQITDLNDDEKIDMLDEAIVLYDTPKDMSYVPNYDGKKHLLDDELRLIIKSIRKRLNKKGQLFMGVDACFSATTDKGGDNVPIRGTDETFILNDMPRVSRKDALELNELLEGKADLGPFILISASEANQVNSQYSKDLGSLTHAIVQGFNSIQGSSDISYSYFFKKYLLEEFDFLKGISSQKPTIIGDIDENVFNTSEVLLKYPYFLTGYFPKDYKKNASRALRLNYGKIHGITNDVMLKIIDRTNDSIVAYAKIVEANEVRSRFVCSSSIAKEILNNALFVPIKLNYVSDDFKISIKQDDYDILNEFLNIKECEAIANLHSIYKLEIDENLYSISDNEVLLVEKKPLSELEYGLIYVSYLNYLYELDKKYTKSTSKNSFFHFETVSPNQLIIHNKKASSYFYNLATLSPSFRVDYPNAEYRNDELFLGGQLGSKSIQMKVDPVKKKLLVFEKKPAMGSYSTNLSLNKSIFNYEYENIQNRFKEKITFNEEIKKILRPEKKIKLFIFE